MSILDLKGRGALVVGGGQGMGRATALLLARAGANPIVLDAERERAEAVAAELEELGARTGALAADVTNAEHVAAAWADIAATDGQVELMVGAEQTQKHVAKAAAAVEPEQQRVREQALAVRARLVGDLVGGAAGQHVDPGVVV